MLCRARLKWVPFQFSAHRECDGVALTDDNPGSGDPSPEELILEELDTRTALPLERLRPAEGWRLGTRRDNAAGRQERGGTSSTAASRLSRLTHFHGNCRRAE